MKLLGILSFFKCSSHFSDLGNSEDDEVLLLNMWFQECYQCNGNITKLVQSNFFPLKPQQESRYKGKSYKDKAPSIKEVKNLTKVKRTDNSSSATSDGVPAQ